MSTKNKLEYIDLLMLQDKKIHKIISSIIIWNRDVQKLGKILFVIALNTDNKYTQRDKRSIQKLSNTDRKLKREQISRMTFCVYEVEESVLLKYPY